MLLVLPRENVHTSFTPAACRTFRTVLFATMPTPRGAGLSTISTLPFFPTTLIGTVCLVLQPHSQLPHPRGICAMLRLASLVQLLIAGLTSSALPVPMPRCPSPSPTSTTARNCIFLPLPVIL